ncbi:DUF2007 domain-containing protein [bacterium]|jgi:hypothetical protein|nr:DUF2007 domain-containing protein [bacterium]
MMDPNPNIKAVIVFTGTTWQSGMVKSLLEDAGIEAYLFDGARGTYNPGWNLPGEGGSVRVMVSEEVALEARLIVEDYQSNVTG